MTTNGQAGAADEPCLLVRADDGTAYAIPRSTVEAHRLTGEQWAALEASMQADGNDVAGYYYGPTGNVGTFGGGPAGPPVPVYNPANPSAGGWDGVGLRYIPAVHIFTSDTATLHKRSRWP
jgi:hypothetical protein